MEKDNKNWLYKFESKQVINKDNGESNTLVKKFGILKPNRRLREEGELFYATETSRFAKAGVLPKAAWNTILSNGGGSISEQERELYGNLLLKFRDLSFELQSILIKGESDRSTIEKKRADEVIVEIDNIRKEIQSFESSQIAIFENTAEAKARNRTILWWITFLSYQENEEGQYVPIFQGETFGDKLLQYDSFEENNEKNEFILGVIRRLTYLITLWFLGRTETNDDFNNFDNAFLKENEQEAKINEEVQEEVSIIEEIKPE